MKSILSIVMLMLALGLQDEAIVLRGRVTSGGRGVPYATLQLAGSSVGVSCNDAGEYEMKVPAGCEGDTVVVRSVGPGRLLNAKIRYEYLIRKRDLTIVRITSSQERIGQLAPQDAWVNPWYTWLTFDADTSAWEYDVRDGRYTMTHYYNYRQFHLGSMGRGHDGEYQYWRQCLDWTLTDFAYELDSTAGDELGAEALPLSGAFGASDFSADYWGRYNSIPIDTLPLRLLTDKFKQYKNE